MVQLMARATQPSPAADAAVPGLADAAFADSSSSSDGEEETWGPEASRKDKGTGSGADASALDDAQQAAKAWILQQYGAADDNDSGEDDSKAGHNIDSDVSDGQA